MQPSITPTRGFVALLATAVGVTAANLYYAQPLVAVISREIGLTAGAAGLVVTLTQVGYGLGVLFVVPLGDIVENRRLVLSMFALTILGLFGLTFAKSLVPYFVAAFATGLGASAVQIIVPYSAALVSDEKRGAMIGSVTSGLMIGIMLSRPTASFMTDLFRWNAVFLLSAFLMIAMGVTLFKLLPPRKPPSNHVRYLDLIRTMYTLFVKTPTLRRRAFYQACVFGAFCLFWTASPLLLASADYGFTQSQIAVFALVGVTGAEAAPFAGRLADRGHSEMATGAALVASSLSFVMSHFFALGSAYSVLALVASALLLDAGTSANLILGQRAIFNLSSENRSRLNALYIATIFIGGASGSALGAWAFSRGGWALTSICGFALPAIALLSFLTGVRAKRAPA